MPACRQAGVISGVRVWSIMCVVIASHLAQIPKLMHAPHSLLVTHY